MGDQLILPGTEQVARVGGFAEAAERAAARVKHPHADNTEAAYGQAWRRWLAHCVALGVPDAPIDPPHLVTYLEKLAEELAPNTVRLHFAALCQWDEAAHSLDGEQLERRPVSRLRRHPIVTRWYRSWSRDHPRAPLKQAPALSVGQVRALLRTAQEPRARSADHAVRYCRDRCLIVWGILAGLRVSELVALDVRDVVVTDRAIELIVRRAKTDQHGMSRTVAVMPQGDPMLCPVEAWRAWSAVRGPQPGPVFLAIHRTGAFGPALTQRQVQRRLTELGRLAGVELLTPHSLRATFATLAVERGRNLLSIAEQGRWLSLETLRGYVRRGTMYRDNPSAGLLDGD